MYVDYESGRTGTLFPVSADEFVAGPSVSTGFPVEVRIRAFSEFFRNARYIDAYGLTVARFDSKKMTPADARHIELAGKAGLGETDIGKLSVKKLLAGRWAKYEAIGDWREE